MKDNPFPTITRLETDDGWLAKVDIDLGKGLVLENISFLRHGGSGYCIIDHPWVHEHPEEKATTHMMALLIEVALKLRDIFGPDAWVNKLKELSLHTIYQEKP